MRTEEEYEKMSFASYRIGQVIEGYCEPNDIVPIVLASLTLWCNKYGVDIEELVALMTETIADKNGIEIGTEGE